MSGRRTLSRGLGAWVAVVVLAGCDGNVSLGGVAGDGGTTGRDAGSSVRDSGKDAANDARDAGKDATSGTKHGKDAGPQSSGTPVDAGIYRGDGSFFVDAGEPPDADTGYDGSIEGGVDGSLGFDATPGCAPLAACCGSLTGASQSLCTTVASAGNATNCSADLTELESGGDCMGVAVLATDMQEPANEMLSDGTTLFFTNATAQTGLQAVPVGGGAVTTLTTGGVTLVAVDDANVYVLEVLGPAYVGLVRIPKSGAAAALVSEAGGWVQAATTLGGTAYWLEVSEPNRMGVGPVVVKSAPLPGGAIVTVARTTLQEDAPFQAFGVDGSTVFIACADTLYELPMTSSGMTSVATMARTSCTALTSDTEAVYCDVNNGSNLRIASDGSTVVLGAAVNQTVSAYNVTDGLVFPTIVVDDTYAYWVNNATAGTVVKTPKGGGGAVTVLARDTNPIAIAVDAHSVYWSDQAGYLKSVPK